MIELAWVVLWSSPIVVLILFRNLEPPMALSVSVIGGYLFLPYALGIDLPVLPVLNKESLVVFSMLALSAVVLAQPAHSSWRLPSWLPASPTVLLLIALLFLGVFGTVLTNPDVLVYGWRHLPGLRLYDAFSVGLETLVLLLPFFVGRMVLSSTKAQKILLQVIVCAALIYSLLVLWEVRMSPQLHRQIYGYSPFSFAQQIRGNGFRPVVFLNHGLALSIFLTMATIAAAALCRAAEPAMRWKWGLAMCWLFVVLVLSKSVGAVLIATVLVPIVLFLNMRMRLLAAFCIALIAVTYPTLRAADLVPVDRAIALAEDFNPERAQSLGIRIHNEDNLLAHARERPLFGWGGWGRHRIYNEEGTDISLTDGYWVIQMGNGGWVRYLAIYGLLCWPLMMFFLRRRDVADPISVGLIFMLCAKLIDFIPNSSMMPLVFLITGALVGRLERGVQEDPAQMPPDGVSPEGPVYTRQKARHSRYARSGAGQEAPSRRHRPYVQSKHARDLTHER